MNDINQLNAEGTLLRQHQLRMLEILCYVDKVCRKNNISYWLSSGTLLGAVRHGGFIPWDDDIDIELMRKDFLRLSKILKKDNKYEFQSSKTDLFYVMSYAKLRDKNSEIQEHGQDNNYKFKGIYIDLFVMEYSHRFWANIYQRLVWKIIMCGAKTKSKWQIAFFVITKQLYTFSIVGIRGISKLFPCKKLRHSYGGGFIDKVRNEGKIFPLSEIEFEGYKFLAPADTDYYLKSMFGDYMKLPDLDKLTFHVQNVKFK